MRNLLFAFFLVLFAPALFAQQGESSAARATSTLQLGMTPFGYFLPGQSHPASIGMYASDNLLLGVSSGRFSVAMDGGSPTGTFDYQSQGLFARWWLGNSVNLVSGYYQREISGINTDKTEITQQGTTTMGIAKGPITSTAQVLNLGIGNQWQSASGWVWGCDWAVYNQLLSHQYSYDLSSYEGYSSAAKARKALAGIEHEFRDIHRLPDILLLYIGFAF